MQRRRLSLSLLAMLVLIPVMARGQTFPAAVQTPWNRYICTRITNAYTPIIGQLGTTLIANSPAAASTQVFNLTLPFNFKFIGTIYTGGSSVLRVGANGYIAFGSPSTSGAPDLSQSTGTQMLFPYWSDIEPKGAPEGGIYWRVDGVTPSRVLTVEWRCQGAAGSPVTRNPGQFQAKLFEGSNKIEFHYSS
ncbi:MAG TPA: hypothetical protein VHI13_11150, partial [Candidatus Kapabacteria bacterium]|nr:hypothetical protein [Candidatus Kapabacteria bacterium]